MKRTLFVTILLVISVSMFAQKDVTKFMGIPVDGFKPEMIKKLKEKGFVSSENDKDILEGEFNGTQVSVHVVTNNNKVCRIALNDVYKMDESDIKIRFNKLCQQFKNNSKYISLDDYTIPDDEDISYEMNVNNKRFEAAFFQKPMVTDSVAVKNEMKEILLQKYSEEELENPTEETIKEMLELSIDYAKEMMLNKSVWFMISEFYGKYFITMFYDNEYNRANGEDL